MIRRGRVASADAAERVNRDFATTRATAGVAQDPSVYPPLLDHSLPRQLGHPAATLRAGVSKILPAGSGARGGSSGIGGGPEARPSSRPQQAQARAKPNSPCPHRGVESRQACRRFPSLLGLRQPEAPRRNNLCNSHVRRVSQPVQFQGRLRVLRCYFSAPCAHLVGHVSNVPLGCGHVGNVPHARKGTVPFRCAKIGTVPNSLLDNS